MRVEPLGDAAWVLRDLGNPAYLVADHLRNAGLPGLLDAAPSYNTIGVYGEPGALSEAGLREAFDAMGELKSAPFRVHEIPVCYEMGEDTSDVCELLGLDAERLKDLHQDQVYECFAVGFCPGFGYLGWLPDQLSEMPRMRTPRTRVEAGSVAITGHQTAVYPLVRPGGWSIIGRTPLTLVDVEDGYFPISAGDRVKFVAIEAREFEGLRGQRL